MNLQPPNSVVFHFPIVVPWFWNVLDSIVNLVMSLLSKECLANCHTKIIGVFLRCCWTLLTTFCTLDGNMLVVTPTVLPIQSPIETLAIRHNPGPLSHWCFSHCRSQSKVAHVELCNGHRATLTNLFYLQSGLSGKIISDHVKVKVSLVDSILNLQPFGNHLLRSK